MISKWTKGLRAQLLLIGFAPVVLIVLICMTLFHLTSDLQKKIDFAYTVRTKSVEQMGVMSAATQEIGRRMWAACLILGNKEQIDKRIEQTQKALDQFDTMKEAYLKLPTDDESKKIFSTVEDAWPKIRTGVTDLFPLLKASTPTEIEKVKTEVERVISTLRVSSDAFLKLAEITHTKIDEEKAAVQAEARSQENLALMISVGGLLFLLAYVIVFANRLSRNLSSIATELESSGNALNNAADQVQGNSEELSQSTTEQAAAIQQTSASVEEINSMILQTADNAKRSTVFVEEEEAVVREGQNFVKQMVHSIHEIDDSSEMLAQEMKRNCDEFKKIVTLIGEIENKTKVINDIVFQTKLLSFNASVEAARAGESGKGFSVVAEEVGNLATMSGKAAKEISALLEGSVKQVEDIVSHTNIRVQELVRSSKTKVETGTRVAGQCENVFLDIVVKVNDVSSRIKEISSASQEQSKGVQEITSAIQQLDATTQKNSTMSRDTAEAAGTLTRQADVLSKVVRQLATTVNGRIAS